jgi:drug/metabolite transporter (DMT)-like permease
VSAQPSHGAEATRAWSAWIAVCLIWGTTYLAIKIALETMPPFSWAGCGICPRDCFWPRSFACAGIAAGVRAWPTLAVVGFFMLAFGNGGVVLAEGWIPAA